MNHKVDGKEKINVELQNRNEYNVIERSESYASGISLFSTSRIYRRSEEL
jgi:hypothetical protein